MARGINKAIIVGTLGRDPEVKYTAGGSAVVNVSVATNESWKDKSTGENVEKTEWHRIVIFGKLAEIAAQYLKKGSQVYFEGKSKPANGKTRVGRIVIPPKSLPTRCKCWVVVQMRLGVRRILNPNRLSPLNPPSLMLLLPMMVLMISLFNQFDLRVIKL